MKAPAVHIDLNTAKVASIYGSISGDVADNFALQYLLTADFPGDRVIVIDSPGGLAAEGSAMIKTMEAEQSRGVHQICVVLRQASSMAFNFLTRCDLRLALPKAKLLMHKIAAGAVECAAYRCTSRHLREQAIRLEKLDEPFRRANARALGMSLKDYDLFCDNEHTWSAETLLKRGYLHGIASVNE